MTLNKLWRIYFCHWDSSYLKSFLLLTSLIVDDALNALHTTLNVLLLYTTSWRTSRTYLLISLASIAFCTKSAHDTRQIAKLELTYACVIFLLKKEDLAFYLRDHLMWLDLDWIFLTNKRNKHFQEHRIIAHTHTHTYIYIHTYMYTYIHTYIYVCIYMYVFV